MKKTMVGQVGHLGKGALTGLQPAAVGGLVVSALAPVLAQQLRAQKLFGAGWAVLHGGGSRPLWRPSVLHTQGRSGHHAALMVTNADWRNMYSRLAKVFKFFSENTWAIFKCRFSS